MQRVDVLATARSLAPDQGSPATSPGAGRFLTWVVALGAVSLLASVLLVLLMPHLRQAVTPVASLNGSTANASGASGTEKFERRAVAVAHVDVEDGIISLYPAQQGRVVALPVPVGKEVEPGTLLLQIDDELPRARLAEAKADLRASQEKLHQAKTLVVQHQKQVEAQQAALEVAKTKHASAQAQFRKVDRLFNRERLSGSAEDVESARKLIDEATAGIRAQQKILERIQSMDPEGAVRLASCEVDVKTKQLARAEIGVRECQVLAPCKGKILRKFVNVGELLGSNPTRPALEFCPSGERIVRAEVEQEFAGRLREGMKATILDDVLGKRKWTGTVKRVSDWYTRRRAVLQEPMQFNDVRTLEVIVSLEPEAQKHLRINQQVRVMLDGE